MKILTKNPTILNSKNRQTSYTLGLMVIFVLKKS